MDYELLGHAVTGLDVIEKLGLQSKSILVSSRYEESAIRERCLRLKVPLIPKGMAGFVPITVKDPAENWDALLIDDDDLVRMTWMNAARSLGKRFRAFSSPAEFAKIAPEVDRKTPIYVDSNLGNGIKGELAVKELSLQGFSDLYLATGYEPEQFASMPWLRVVGKEPPWLGSLEF